MRNYNYGSAAPNLRPKPRVNKEQERLKKLRKDIAMENAKNKLKKQNRKKIKTYIAIFTVSITLGLTVHIKDYLYTSKKAYTDLQRTMFVMSKDNEDMRSKIILESGIGNILAEASELELTEVPKENFLEMDLDKNNFAEPELKPEKNIIEKIISLSFLQKRWKPRR